MRIVCVDDEKIMLRGIMTSCQGIDGVEDVQGFTNSKEALDYILDNEVDVVFSDINMPSMNGMEFGAALKQAKPQVKLIFTTGYDEYALDAFKLHASGYLMKPVEKEDLKRELDNINIDAAPKKEIVVQTFGNFEVFVDGKPVEFARKKTKELMAFLVDRNGSVCTNNEICATLWEDDEDHLSYLKKLRRDLIETLDNYGYSSVVVSRWGGLGILKDAIQCDVYDYHGGSQEAIRTYNGEYMLQYSWAEYSATKPKL